MLPRTSLAHAYVIQIGLLNLTVQRTVEIVIFFAISVLAQQQVIVLNVPLMPDM